MANVHTCDDEAEPSKKCTSIDVDAQYKMVPNQAPPTTTTVTEPLPPLTRSTTLPAYPPRPTTTDRSLLTPEDAIYQGSPPRRLTEVRIPNGPTAAARVPRERPTVRNRSASRRRKGVWKKLLWVKQSCQFYNLLIQAFLTIRRSRQLY